MSEWAHEHPEEAERISHLPPSERLEAERAVMVDPLAVADEERKRRRENPCPECSGTGTLLRGSGEEGDCYACKGDGHRKVGRIPFERIILDASALVWAADLYEKETGSVDELALGSAIETYLEAEKAA